MLDTYGRKYVNPLIKKVANFFIKLNISANSVTKLAFILGIFSGLFVYFGKAVMAVVVLWISGLLDAVDGEVARQQKDISDWGTLMDITFDRMVELSVLLALGLKYPNSRIHLIFLSCAIIISMTIFLTAGALFEKSSNKSFYYQAGLMERTEGFIMFTLMILFDRKLSVLTIVYAVLVFITAMQRLVEARRVLDD